MLEVQGWEVQSWYSSRQLRDVCRRESVESSIAALGFGVLGFRVYG